MRAVPVLLLAAFALRAQTPGSLGPAQMVTIEMNALCVRLLQLMDAGGVAVPELQRAAGPMLDTARRSCAAVEAQPGAGQPTYALLRSANAYLDLFEAVPKPYPFPDVARDQFRELRELTVRLETHFAALLDAKDAELRSPDRDRTLYFQEENRLLPPPTPNGRRVVFLGDSITALWRLNEYFPEEDFINRGIIGQLSGQLLTRMRADVIALKPVAVTVQAGTFDLARNVPLTAIQDNLTLIADIAAANNIKLLLAAVLPVSAERAAARPAAAIRALNDWIQAFCAQRGCTFVDFHTPLADPQGVLLADASDDGLHPNGKGYRLMAPVLAQAIELATRPAPRAPAPASPAKPQRQR